ncbi:MAG: DUF4038 domain-containing protein [Fimbriimonadaceae bacterium]|nr:DUF4038 domain-containing protein [Fimbriimonadaceae bacterium]
MNYLPLLSTLAGGPVPLHGVAEVMLTAATDYAAPLWEVSPQVTFQDPAGGSVVVEAFWDGGRTWRARCCPAVAGTWQWRATCPQDAGLAGAGRFEVAAAPPRGAWEQHGRLVLSTDRRRLAHLDGTPFLWLADTAWNGALRSTAADWHEYLATRRTQGLSVVQVVLTQWRGARQRLPQQVYLEGDRLSVNPTILQQLDARLAAVNAAGLVAAPVLLWALWDSDPGWALSLLDAQRLARYLVARYGAYQVVWFLGGDGNFAGARAERWRTLGRTVFDEPRQRLVTLHPCGQSWIGDDFAAEPWYDWIGYQSSHGGGEGTQRFIVSGEAARLVDPPRPVINLEPCYEAHPGRAGGGLHGAYEVRRALWWSLLSAPTAGVTYGHHAVWPWATTPEVPEGHERLGVTPAWRAGLRAAGLEALRVVRQALEELPWWTLRPAPELLTLQPGTADVFAHQAIARGDGVVLAYLPRGGELRLRTALSGPARWIDPQTGAATAAVASATMAAPTTGDWLLVGSLD